MLRKNVITLNPKTSVISYMTGLTTQMQRTCRNAFYFIFSRMLPLILTVKYFFISLVSSLTKIALTIIIFL